MSYVYVMPADHEPQRQVSTSHHRTVERTPLGKVLRWVAEKSVNEVLDAVLRLFLEGGWPVRLAGSIVTGVVAASVVWLASGTVLSTLLGSVTATAIGVGAAAGLAMGFSGGLLAGAGAGWLLAIAAESVSTELTKDRLGLHVATWIAWSLAALAGGLAGWLVGRLTDLAERHSPTAGRAIRILGYLLLFAATAVVLVRTGTSTAFWSTLETPAEAVGRQSNAFALGIAAGILSGLAAATYLRWLLPTTSRTHQPHPKPGRIRPLPTPGPFHRRHLPLAQAVLTALTITLAANDPTPASNLPTTAVLIAAIWTLPWTLTLAIHATTHLHHRLTP
ncbi:hypothetical protein ACFTSF_23635 [Kribbella sp. NPDC056951]|uniref:hypothetical protein n=1 Tax=Kribbella sp. NPDC056951 TaxID=3345978 RepID=UPI00362B6DC0